MTIDQSLIKELPKADEDDEEGDDNEEYRKENYEDAESSTESSRSHHRYIPCLNSPLLMQWDDDHVLKRK